MGTEKMAPLGKATLNKGSIISRREDLGCGIELGTTRSRATILPVVSWKTCFGRVWLVGSLRWALTLGSPPFHCVFVWYI